MDAVCFGCERGPFDVMDFGRMAVISDPTGAHFSVWEPKTHKGTRITGVPGTMCWADLNIWLAMRNRSAAVFVR